MSEEEATVVKAPPAVERVKNPRKVAAGKKLAERNKEYKEYFEKHHAVKEVAEPKQESSSETGYFVLIVVIVAGIAFYGYKHRKVAEPVRMLAPSPPLPPKKQDRMFEF